MPKHGEGIQPREHNGGHSATSSSGENHVFQQEDQEPKAILPSYYSDIGRKALESRWLDPRMDKELLRGWDSLAELAIDKAGLVHKPNRPNIPKDDIPALDEDNDLAHDMTANLWEKEVLFALDVAEDRHLIPEFKRQMQEYRNTVKGIVQLWREKGLL